MNIVLRKILIFLALNLALNPAFAFARGSYLSAGNQEPAQNNFQTVSIIVSQAKPRSQVIMDNIASKIVAGAECDFNIAGNLTFVQNTGALNLNQPASCFGLSIGKQFQPQIKLAVRPLINVQPQVVVLPAAKISSDYYQTAANHPVQSSAAIPASVMLMIFAALGFSIRALKTNKAPLSSIKQALNLQQLQIMRC